MKCLFREDFRMLGGTPTCVVKYRFKETNPAAWRGFLLPKDIYSEFWYNMVALKMVAEKEMKTTTEESFESVVGQASELVIADFYSQSCKPCLLMHSDLEELEREYDGRMKLVRVDIAESVDLASRY